MFDKTRQLSQVQLEINNKLQQKENIISDVSSLQMDIKVKLQGVCKKYLRSEIQRKKWMTKNILDLMARRRLSKNNET